MDPALAIQNVSHRYGTVQALEDISFDIPRGRFCALLGLNGAGKTTLFSLITRLFDIVGGRIAILGHDVRREQMSAHARLGVVFQARTVDPELTVLQNLVYHGGLHGMPVDVARDRAMTELDRIGLAQQCHKKISELSGGQVRRVEISRALVHKPRLILLDEATTGLDVDSRLAIQTHLRRLVADDGIAVLWATHLLDEVRAEDQVVILHQGQLLANDSGSAIIKSQNSDTLADAFGRFVRQENKQDETA